MKSWNWLVTRRVLSIGAGIHQLPLIQAIQEMGYSAYAVDIDPDAPGTGLANHYAPLSIFNVSAIIKWADEQKIDAVLTTSSGKAIATVCQVARSLNLAGPGETASQNSLNKLAWKPIISSNLIATPHYVELNADTPLPDYPCLLKPAVGVGGRGIIQIEPGSSCPELPESEVYFLEEYLEGEVITLYGTVANSIPKLLLAANKIMTPDLGTKQLIEIEKTTEYEYLFAKVTGLLEINFGPIFQIDLISHQGKNYVIDVGIELDPKLPPLLENHQHDIYQTMIYLALA